MPRHQIIQCPMLLPLSIQSSLLSFYTGYFAHSIAYRFIIVEARAEKRVRERTTPLPAD